MNAILNATTIAIVARRLPRNTSPISTIRSALLNCSCCTIHSLAPNPRPAMIIGIPPPRVAAGMASGSANSTQKYQGMA